MFSNRSTVGNHSRGGRMRRAPRRSRSARRPPARRGSAPPAPPAPPSASRPHGCPPLWLIARSGCVYRGAGAGLGQWAIRLGGTVGDFAPRFGATKGATGAPPRAVREWIRRTKRISQVDTQNEAHFSGGTIRVRPPTAATRSGATSRDPRPGARSGPERGAWRRHVIMPLFPHRVSCFLVPVRFISKGLRGLAHGGRVATAPLCG